MIDNKILQDLLAGNTRFVSGEMLHPNQTPEHRAELVSGQRPKVVVVSCSDSRVTPEIIFDQGLGDIFPVRTAGHVIDDVALASIEYAVEHLHAGLIMVLGHKKCGAIQAAIAGGEAHGHLGVLIDKIKPAVEQAKTTPGDLTDNCVKNNVALTVNELKSSAPVLNELINKNQLQVIGAYYDLDSGVVTVLS